MPTVPKLFKRRADLSRDGPGSVRSRVSAFAAGQMTDPEPG
ncbi:hypothetical protein ABIE45_000413 [Methylobacterium sp. OAE515]